MRTYTTIDGRVLDLSAASTQHWVYLERLYRRLRSTLVDGAKPPKGLGWKQVGRAVYSTKNPLLAATDGRVTRDVWADPLFQALADLDDRVGVAEGGLRPSRPNYPRDPMVGAEPISVALAARRKGVSVKAVHKAIQRGDVIAEPIAGPGSSLRVSLPSLDAWEVSSMRQAAGKKARTG